MSFGNSQLESQQDANSRRDEAEEVRQNNGSPTKCFDKEDDPDFFYNSFGKSKVGQTRSNFKQIPARNSLINKEPKSNIIQGAARRARSNPKVI